MTILNDIKAKSVCDGDDILGDNLGSQYGDLMGDCVGEVGYNSNEEVLYIRRKECLKKNVVKFLLI